MLAGYFGAWDARESMEWGRVGQLRSRLTQGHGSALGRAAHLQRDHLGRGQPSNRAAVRRRADDADGLPRRLRRPDEVGTQGLLFSSHLVLALEAVARWVD